MRNKKLWSPLWALIITGLLLNCVDFGECLFQGCKYKEETFNPEIEVQKYGAPTPFVSTKSIGISPYSLVDPYRQSTLYHEYLLIGPGFANTDSELVEDEEKSSDDESSEEIQLIIYDADTAHTWVNEPNLVQHNLGKEYNWALINATGMLPSLTVSNTTFEKTFRFHTDEGDTVAYHLKYPNLFRSKETTPPIDVLIEFPAKTRTLLTLKTMIDYQTFGLLRWRLTPAEPVPWRDIEKHYEYARTHLFVDECDKPETHDAHETKREAKPGEHHEAGDHEKIDFKTMLCIYQRRFQRIENPCLKDMFVFRIIRGEKGDPDRNTSYTSVSKLFIIIPMVYDVLSYRGWYDLTEAYCSRPEEPEECGEPLDVVLTNDHLLILTDRGLYVSNSLNTSTANVSLPYSIKPLLKFTPIDPCATYPNFNCSEVGAPILARQTITRMRLFYTPICHLFQHPIYEDMVVLAIDHVSQGENGTEEVDLFTILYAARPYNNWKVLFHAQHDYVTSSGSVPISQLIGVFFNHHRRHFDISLLLNEDGKERTIRFVLPEPASNNEELMANGYKSLSGLLGKGFLEFEFPETFHMTHVTVHPEPYDVYFLGDQMWIAEAADSFVYLSVSSVYNHNNDESYFDDCSFNHPDRTFVCTERDHAAIFVGRVGVTYSPIGVDYRKINEFKYTMLYNLWPFKYRQHLALLGHFTAGYSGKIMFWYLYDHNKLVEEQKKYELLSEGERCQDKDKDVNAVKCRICETMKKRKEEYGCQIAPIDDKENDPRFRMLAFEPTSLHVRDTSTHGPLIPYLIDGDKVVLYEADIPLFEGYKPDYNYMHDINVGNKILCLTHDNHPHTKGAGPADTGNPPDASQEKDGKSTCDDITGNPETSACELYIRHMKRLAKNGTHTFLDGIRRSIYATVIKSFPLIPIPTTLLVLVLKDTNHAVVQLDTEQFAKGKEFLFKYEHLGQTLYIPQHMSILLTGFPKFKGDYKDFDKESTLNCQGQNSEHDMSRMVGYATRYYRQGKRLQLKPFEAFLVNFTTVNYCKFYKKALEKINDDCTERDIISDAYMKRRNLTDRLLESAHTKHKEMIESLNNIWKATFKAGPEDGDDPLFEQVDDLKKKYQDEEEKHLSVRKDDLAAFLKENREKLEMSQAEITNSHTKKGAKVSEVECPADVIWHIADGGCHLQLYLAKHPVLKQNGGRISLDKYDSLSFTVKLRSLTPLGKSLIHRPLMIVTNTNPDIITVDRKVSVGKDPQAMVITLTPTGLKKGVATVTVRPLIVSTHCPFADGSFSLIVQVQRRPGRKLHINYPIPICKPEPDEGLDVRPWKIDLPGCVTRDELLSNKLIRRGRDRQIFYATLPINYRPPSSFGAEIPTSENIYNVDPQLPNFKDWYIASKDKGTLIQCAGKRKRKDCHCTENDQLSDDEYYTDCKRTVYTVKRGFKIDISAEYDRIMRDEDQHKEFYSPKVNWTVHIEEVNNRTEYTLTSGTSQYLRAVDENSDLHHGYKFFNAETLGVTLHGTGLYHFKVTLGNFESFDEVTGYFILYCADNELNHIQLIVIMLFTIMICMMLVFCGFLLVRGRLSSQLPYQTLNRNKMKLE